MGDRSMTDLSFKLPIAKNALALLMILAVLAASSFLLPGVFAMPSVPSEFRGWVIVDGKYARDGTEINVLDSSGTVCGVSFVKGGLYGSLSCLGDDPSTATDEGAALYEPLTFSINNRNVSTRASVLWYPGQAKEVNLILGNLNKAELLMLRLQPKTKASLGDAMYILLLSLLIISSLAFISYSMLNLLKLSGSRHKKNLRRGLR
jgi:hypothetical protein